MSKGKGKVEGMLPGGTIAPGDWVVEYDGDFRG